MIKKKISLVFIYIRRKRKVRINIFNWRETISKYSHIEIFIQWNFSLNRLNDRCRKLIEGKSGLFFLELIIHKTNKGEIFGARSVPERKVKTNELFS
jgi:hypothetical protein